MIEVKTEKGNASCSIDGTLPELFSDTMFILRTIYLAIKNDDEPAAEDFKNSLVTFVKCAFEEDEKAVMELAGKILSKEFAGILSKDDRDALERLNDILEQILFDSKKEGNDD